MQNPPTVSIMQKDTKENEQTFLPRDAMLAWY